MNYVTRYEATTEWGNSGMAISSEGEFVYYENYTALQEQLTATTNSLTNAQEALKSAGIDADTVQAGVMELVSRMNQMVAECSALIDANSLALDILCDDNTFVATEWRKSTSDVRVETPATEAYLNAVRAEGVEMLSKLIERTSGMLYADSVKSTCTEFAAQLRAGNTGKDGNHE